jgi:hypothetical protein
VPKQSFSLILQSAFLLTSICPNYANTAALRFETLRFAIDDLIRTYGDDYPMGASYLRRLDRIQTNYTPGNVLAKSVQYRIQNDHQQYKYFFRMSYR